MKLVSMLVAFCFTANVFASTGVTSAVTADLERVVDEYQYSLSVEWDQKDQKVYQAQTNAFLSKLSVLVKEKGVKQEEMIALVEKKMGNKAAVEAMKLKLSLLSGAASQADIAKIISENSNQFYSKGASWNGDVLVPVALGLLVAAIVGYAVWFHATHTCVAWEQRWECRSDVYYNEYDYYSHGSAYTTCGWEDYCSRYEKDN